MIVCLSANAQTCFVIKQVFTSDSDLSIGSQIHILDDVVLFNQESLPVESRNTFALGERFEVAKVIQCITDLAAFPEEGIFYVTEIDLSNNETLTVLRVDSSPQSYLIHNEAIYLAWPCDSNEVCYGNRYYHPILSDASVSITPITNADAFVYSPPSFFTLTEEILFHDSYRILSLVDAQFETVTEEVLDIYTVICPDQNPIYEDVTEQVLLREASSVLQVVPAQFELVTELILLSDAHTRVETFPITNPSDSISLIIGEGYSDYSWAMNQAGGNCPQFEPCIDVSKYHVDPLKVTLPPASDWGCDIEPKAIALQYDVEAMYELKTRIVLTQPATTTSTEVPAIYETRPYVRLVNKAEIPDSCIVGEYSFRTYERLTAPATTISEEVPAQYSLIQRTRLKEDANIENLDLDDSCQFTFDSYQLIKDGYEEVESYPCEILSNPEAQLEIVETLFSFGYLEDPNTAYGSTAFWVGLMEFYDNLVYDTNGFGNIDSRTLDFLIRP